MNPEAQIAPADTLMSRFLARASFPVTMVALTGIGIVAMQRGYSALLTLTLLSLASLIIVIVLEQINPHTTYWKKPQGDVLTDLLHMLISGVLIPPATGVVWRVLIAGWAASLSVWLGVGLWPDQWPMVAQLTLALVIAELGQYWWHRLAHEKDFLWRFHSTHHSPGRLYFLNTGRFHPIDMFVAYSTEIIPLVVLGAGEEVIALWTLVTTIHGLFQHANTKTNIGWLNWVFSMAELHRWHHSLEVEKANTNYGANLICWDIVFGTRYLPKDETHQPDDVGIGDLPDFPKGYLEQLAVPFRWRKTKEESRARLQPTTS
jgi:sterol desaturase/sphingolipid hydroxylase (fatty acid hydroxylase superfamily)